MSEFPSIDPLRPDDRFFLAQSRFEGAQITIEELERSIFIEELKNTSDLDSLEPQDLLRVGMQRVLADRDVLDSVVGALIEHYSMRGDAVRLEFLLSFLSRELLGVEHGDLSSTLSAQTDVQKFFGVAGALSWACSMAIHSGNLKTVQLLQQYGILTLGFENSACASTIAVTEADESGIEDAFFDVLSGESEIDRSFSTYLHDAVVYGNFEIVEWLLAQPEVDPLTPDGYGNTAYGLGLKKIADSERKAGELRKLLEKLSGREHEWCTEEIRLMTEAQGNRRRCIDLLKPK